MAFQKNWHRDWGSPSYREFKECFMLRETDFVVGRDSFADLIINPLSENGSFYYFFNQRHNRLVKRFAVDCTHPNVHYFCEVTLIKKEDKFTPRLHFTTKDQTGRLRNKRVETNEETIELKASISLNECYLQVWQLISYLNSLATIDRIPDGRFSMVSEADAKIVGMIRQRDPASVKSIFKQLARGLTLSHEELNEVLQRKERLKDFGDGIDKKRTEPLWQDFFEKNTWIFGYGLNYVILRVEQTQPRSGGADLAGKGERISDFMTRTGGEVQFTVLVEIKTAETQLLTGKKSVRSGAWSLNKDLTDALTQIQASVEQWSQYGSKNPKNQERLEKRGIYTIKPKGIIVVGCLGEVADDLDKRATFELFRRSVHGIEIITFDELYDRAKFIVEHQT
jgi:Domain of unknown function (DUF4263)